MTPDEAMQHPWILEQFQSPSTSAAASDQSNNLEHMGDSASDRAPSTSGAHGGGRRREGVLNNVAPSITGTCTVT